MIEIIREHNMALDTESDWILIQGDRFLDFEKKENQIKSIQLVWDNVLGTPNGELIFLISNDMENSTIAKVIPVNTNSNRNDSELIVFYPCFKYLKIVYKKNDISYGNLSINISSEN